MSFIFTLKQVNLLANSLDDSNKEGTKGTFFAGGMEVQF